MESEDSGATVAKLTRRGLLGSAGMVGAGMMMQAAAAAARAQVARTSK